MFPPNLSLKTQCISTILERNAEGQPAHPIFRTALKKIPQERDNEGKLTKAYSDKVATQLVLIDKFKLRPKIEIATLTLFEDDCEEFTFEVIEAAEEIINNGSAAEKAQVSLVLVNLLQNADLPMSTKDKSHQLVRRYLEDLAVNEREATLPFDGADDTCVQLIANLNSVNMVSDETVLLMNALKNVLLKEPGKKNTNQNEGADAILFSMSKILLAACHVSQNKEVPEATKKLLYGTLKEVINSQLFRIANRWKGTNSLVMFSYEQLATIVSDYLKSEMQNGNVSVQ